MFDVVTVGDAVSDIFINSPEITTVCPLGKIRNKTCPQPVICLPFGEKISIVDFHQDIGGSAANVAVGLSRLGFQVGFVGILGKDQTGQEISYMLKKEGVETKMVKVSKTIKTSFSFIINFEGERTILTYRGLKDYSKIKIPHNLKTKWCYLGPLGEGFERLYSDLVAWVATHNIKLAINPGGLQIRSRSKMKGILKVTKILFVNKEEADEFIGSPRPLSIKETLKFLGKQGPEVVVVTNGPAGAYSFDKQEFLYIPPYQAKRIETTGAGDAFSSGCLAALIKNKGIAEGLRWGVVNSASVIEKIGAEKGLLTASQIQQRLKKAPFPERL